MNKDVQVAIIGGGLSGLMAAQSLRKKGVEDIIIIDKSRSVGGRLATRRIKEGRVDHGAQFFTVRTKAFQAIVDNWLEAGWVRFWFGNTYPRYLSEGGMNALAKHIAEGTSTLLNTRVVSIEQAEDGYVLLTDAQHIIRANAVIVTAPVPQATELVESFANDEQLAQLESIQYDPCFVGILEFTGESHFGEAGHQDKNLPQGVLRIVDHQQKGVSSIPTVSVYMTGEWSAPRFEQGDAEILAQIKSLVEELLPLNGLRSEQLKRWRYAQAKTVIREPFLKIASGLFVAGDAFLCQVDDTNKARFESAVLSGLSVGEQLAEESVK